MHARGAVVVGCGIMGRDVAALFLVAGWAVQVVLPAPKKWSGAAQRIADSCGQIGSFDSKKLYFHTSLEQVTWDGVAVVLECVSENLTLKQSIFRQLDALAPMSVVLGSNSSGMRITDIAVGLPGAHRMANTHFFQPAHLVPLVEIAKGEQTSVDTVNALYEIFTSIHRAPVRVNRDVPGFLANRIQHALMREAFSVIDEGIATAQDVDVAVQFGFGFRYVAAGPMLLKEFAGFDTQYAAASVIYPSLCNASAPGQTLSTLVEEGRLGMKVKKGFQDWTDEAILRERDRYEKTLIEAVRILG